MDSDQLHPLQDLRHQGTGAGYQLAGKHTHTSTPQTHTFTIPQKQEPTTDILGPRHRKEAKDRNIS